MGGLLILIPWVASTLLWASLSNRYVWIVLMVTVAFGMLGFLDDYYKVTKRTADGLSGRSRLLIEFGVAFVATWRSWESEAPALSGALAVPFIKTALLPLGLFFIIVGGFVIAGAANAVNFTDGLDGLAIVPVMIAAATFTLIVYLVGNEKFAGLSGRFPISTAPASWRCSWPRWSAPAWASSGTTRRPPPSSWAIPVRCRWAAHWARSPSSVKHEIVLAIVGGLFVLETVSVIVQVVSFKLTGKRVFRMAPIHHHYEQLGWTEPTIVIRFWIVAVVLALARACHLETAVGA